MSASLPADAENQTYVTVHALLAGGLWLPQREVFQDSIDKSAELGSELPFIAFLVTHPTYGRVLFDLGMRKHAKGWPPAVQPALDAYRISKYCDEDIVDVLRESGVDPAEITKVIYSHLHWDHVGDPTPFTNAEIVMGSDAKVLLEDAWPSNPESVITALPLNMKAEFIDFADPKKYKKIAPWGTYDRAVDFYGDGSFYLVDSPGHIPGHLAAAARIAGDSFVFFAADTCHDRQCYEPGERLVCEIHHRDVETARDTVRRLVKLNAEYPNVIIVLAHESQRKHEMPFLPGSDLRQWVEGEIEERRRDLSV